MVLQEGVLPELIDLAIKELPPPNLFVHGEPVRTWRWVLREHCTGPVTEAAGAAPATFFYCLSEDHKTAWLTVVPSGCKNMRSERFWRRSSARSATPSRSSSSRKLRASVARWRRSAGAPPLCIACQR